MNSLQKSYKKERGTFMLIHLLVITQKHNSYKYILITIINKESPALLHEKSWLHCLPIQSIPLHNINSMLFFTNPDQYYWNHHCPIIFLTSIIGCGIVRVRNQKFVYTNSYNQVWYKTDSVSLWLTVPGEGCSGLIAIDASVELELTDNSSTFFLHVLSNSSISAQVHQTSENKVGHVNEYPTMHCFGIPRHTPVKDSLYDFDWVDAYNVKAFIQLLGL